MQIFVSNQSLVLQKVDQDYILNIFLNNFLQVTRTQAGNYTCHASNVEGDAESKPVTLTIMCKCCFDLLFKSRLLKKKGRFSF